MPAQEMHRIKTHIVTVQPIRFRSFGATAKRRIERESSTAQAFSSRAWQRPRSTWLGRCLFKQRDYLRHLKPPIDGATAAPSSYQGQGMCDGCEAVRSNQSTKWLGVESVEETRTRPLQCPTAPVLVTWSAIFSPCVTFRLVVVSLRGPGQSPVLPFACCVGWLLPVGRCGRCSCWCRFRVRGVQWLVCWGCAGCGSICRARQRRSVVAVLGLCCVCSHGEGQRACRFCRR